MFEKSGYLRMTRCIIYSGALLWLLCGCGERGGGAAPNGSWSDSTPSAVVVKTGSLAVDSWGYTGAAPVQVAAPAKTTVAMQGHTLLEDSARTVVSGNIPTAVSYSSDVTTLPTRAQTAAPGAFVCYVDLSIGVAVTAIPAATVTVDVGASRAGQTVTVYRYDAGRWLSAQNVTVDGSGKAAFPVSDLALWGVFQ